MDERENHFAMLRRVSSFYSETGKQLIDLNQYKLTFSDEFDSLSLNTGNGGTWQPSYSWSPNGFTDSTLSSWTVNPAWGPTSGPDARVYSNSGGVTSLAIKPTPSSVKPSDVGNKPFLSGQLTTKLSFSQTYGYFEVNARLAAGAGVNSAFWLLPADGTWPPELDVVELLGADPTTMIMTAHQKVGDADEADPSWTTIPDASKAFHRYGIDWKPDQITWYFDGKEVGQKTTPASMNKPMYLLLSVMTGTSDSWIGAPGPGLAAHMDVDYVKVYAANPDTAPAASETAASPSAAANTLSVSISQDAWRGDAQYTIAVDGKTIGGVRTAAALHTTGDSQVVTLSGDWGSGAHTVEIAFLNDAYGGTPTTDRNLYVDGVSLDGRAATPASAVLYAAGKRGFSVPPAAKASKLTLHLAEDAYQGDAQYSIAIDGRQIGPAGTVTASNAAGQTQTVDIAATLAPGRHELTLSFLNDAYGGTPGTDRNLFLKGAEVDGTPIPGALANLYKASSEHLSFVVV